MVNRRVRWNMTTDTGEQTSQRHRYIVAIVNEPREIKKIRQKFYEQLEPVSDINEICDCIVSGSNGLHGLVFAFSSDVGEIRYPDKIYRNRKEFRRDWRLFERNEIRMLAYISNRMAA